MPKGQKHDEQDKRDAVARFKALGGDAKALKETAAELGVMPKTVQKWARSLNSKKAPKRKVAKSAVKAKSTEAQWQEAFDEFIQNRDSAKFWTQAAEASRKKLEKIVRELK